MSLDDDFAMKLAMDIEQEREALIDLCARLIAEPTMNPIGENNGSCERLAGLSCRSWGPKRTLRIR